MKKTIFILLTSTFIGLNTINAQKITGNLENHPNQTIYLFGYDNFSAYVIDSTYTGNSGNFSVTFSSKDYGMGYLQLGKNKPIIVVLANENIELTGDATQLSETLKITKGHENTALITYATAHPKRENALSAWRYLNQLYTEDAIFLENTNQQKAIANEIKRLKEEDAAFINSLYKDSYVRWFLPIQTVVSSVGTVAQYRTEEIPATRDALRNINYADERLYKSGLLKESIENHIWFIENSSGSLDTVFADLNKSIDIIIDQVKDNNEKFNLITKRLFEVLEKRSLFTSSEYLAKRLLEDNDCGCLNPDFEKQLHKYGKMAIGATAPDISFTEFTYFPEGVHTKKLSEVQADYYLVIFAAGWCPHCTEAMPKIKELYPSLKEKNIEVVLVSLDVNAQDFSKFAAPLPFISTTDYKKWDGQAVADYQVFSTPSYFMLDKNRTIVQKLQSVEHLEAWMKTVKVDSKN